MRTRFGTAPLRIAIVIPESPDVKTFRFVPVDGASLPFIHQAGQYLTLTLEIDGKRIRRSYTISSPPTRSGSLDITVKREPKGLASTFLHDRIQAGDELTVSGPGGKLTFDPRSASRLVLIGGGIGITPLMSQIRHLTDLGWTGEIQLIHSVRTPADAVFQAELAELARRHPNLKVTVTATRDAGPDWTGERGRIDAEMIRRHVPDLSDARVHLCGPTEMAGPLTDTLVALGIPIDRIHQETFTSATRRDGEPATAVAPVDIDPAATLSFARSGRTVGELRGRTVLEVAEANGVAISYDCRSGVCGQCKTRLIAGDVTMDADDALTASDRTAGQILACQARCRTDVTVDA
jgi:ferredoxin-NADP reductase